MIRTATYDATISARAGAERVVEVRAVPWEVTAETPDGPEQFARGAFADAVPERVTLEAIGPHGRDPGVRLVGRGTHLEDREDGLHAAFAVSRTAAGDELLELVRDGVYRGASVVFTPSESREAGGVTVHTKAELLRLGIVERGAYAGAEVLAVRSEDAQPMADTTAATIAADAATAERVAVDTPDMQARMEELRTDLVARMASLEARTGREGRSDPLARWASLGEYVRDAAADPEAAVLLARALADQVTTANPGVMAGGGVAGEVRGILESARPAIEALGGPAGLGASGMSVHFPYFAGDLSALVGKQTAEKTEITSVVVPILDGSAPIETFAGGSDISYQLIRRSSPSYIEAYTRIMLAAWGLVTEAEFENDLEAGATGTVTGSIATPEEAAATFFAASAAVKAATGGPATAVLAASDVFAALGGMLIPAAYGTVNQAGTAQASTLRVNVSGLEVVEASELAPGSALFTNERAARWHEDGPFVATAEDVAKLGQNRAIWSMGASGIFTPAGIVKATGMVLPLAAGSRGRTSKAS